MNEIYEVLEFIPYGRENAIRRHELRELTHMSDRKLRMIIQMAKQNGEIVINLQDGRGYYRSDEIDDIEAQYKLNLARIKSLSIQQKKLRKLLKEAGRI